MKQSTDNSPKEVVISFGYPSEFGSISIPRSSVNADNRPSVNEFILELTADPVWSSYCFSIAAATGKNTLVFGEIFTKEQFCNLI